MAAPKWFDLKDFNSKADRIGDHGGHYKLRLEVDVSRLEDHDDQALLEAGWAEELPRQTGEKARAVLVNDRLITSAAKVAESIGLFFSVDELRANYVRQDQLRQDERTDGLAEKVVANDWEVAETVAGVSELNRARILSTVEKAIAARLVRDRDEARVPLHQNGLAVFNFLGDFREEFPPTVDGRDAGRFAIRLLGEAHGFPNGEIAARLDQLALDLEHGNAKGVEAIREWLKDECLDENGHFPGKAKERPESNTENQRARDQLLMDAVQAGHIDARSVTPIKANLNERRTVDSLIQNLPFAVKRDNTIPSRVLADHVVAVTRSVDTVARILGTRRDSLMMAQDITPLRFSSGAVSTDRATTARTRASGAKNEETGEVEFTPGIAVSVKRAGAFVHELAHAMDFGNSLSDEERTEMLERCGALPHIQSQVGEAFDPNDKEAKYLSDPKEVFARTFNAAMVNRVRSEGDKDCLTLGGPIACELADRFSVIDQHEITEAFIEEFQAVLSQRHENSQHNDNEDDLDAEEQSAVVAGPQP